MCGIVAYIGSRDATAILLEGLQRLEYRGYDSAGVAVIGSGGLKIRKKAGKVADLKAEVPPRFKGSPGIGHTRWATHGAPTDANAHPHTDEEGRVAVVHNGIIENAGVLRAKLEADGVTLRSETDSEVLAHLIARAEGAHLEDRVANALAVIEGTYGIAVVDASEADRVVVARNGSPLIIGVGMREMLAASDVSALVQHTRQVVHLDDGEMAVLNANEFRTFTLDRKPVSKSPSEVELTGGDYGKAGYEHFLRKEIHEQPDALARTLSGRMDERFAVAHLGGLGLEPRDVAAIRRVKILGCGSAYFAGRVGAGMIESLARIPADAEPASEYRYRNPVVDPDTLYVAVSQSGETFDTLAAVREVQRKGARVLGVVNVVGSTVARECDGGIYLHAGPEQSVASTKTFTSTAVAFALLALFLGRIKDMGPSDGRRIMEGLKALPEQVRQILAAEDQIREVAESYAGHQGMLFIGRVNGYPVACEGAQKLKEISYVHAEAYAASELKHGPLALVSPDMPTVAIVPDDDLIEKNLSSIAEVGARKGQVITVGHRAGLPGADAAMVVPKNEPELDPVLLSIPLQLFAYHMALALGREIDQPRNLAKSVTVE
ncbi:MAG: glutamine--fructose-6-phosphate transaminase (isomerizing) [Acidimicrobiales bacterium]